MKMSLKLIYIQSTDLQKQFLEFLTTSYVQNMIIFTNVKIYIINLASILKIGKKNEHAQKFQHKP